jgi:hypothetical protein
MRPALLRFDLNTTPIAQSTWGRAIAVMLLAGTWACSGGSTSNGDGGSPDGGSGGNTSTGSGGGSATGGGSVTGGGNGTGTGGSVIGGDGAATSSLAMPCAAQADCGDGLKCIKATDSVMYMGGPAHGYCTKDCTMPADCAPLGGDCIQFINDTTDGGGTGVCVLGCTYGSTDRASKCHARADVACVGDVGQSSVCIPMCSQDVDCPSGRKCDPQAGVCVDLAPPGDPLGTYCSGDAGTSNCAGGCLGYASATFCTMRCVLGELNACNHAMGAFGTGAHGICNLGDPNAGPGDMGYCVQECETAQDCSDTTDPGLLCNLQEKSITGHGFCDWGAASPGEGGI